MKTGGDENLLLLILKKMSNRSELNNCKKNIKIYHFVFVRAVKGRINSCYSMHGEEKC